MRFLKHLKSKDRMGRKTRSGILALMCFLVSSGGLKAEQYYNFAVEKRDGSLAKATIVNGDSISREIFDSDQDGWCDIWMSINPDEKGALTVLGDCDGDGLTDYEEMILWRNPFVAGPLPQKQMVLGEEEKKHLQWKRKAKQRIQSRLDDELKLREFYQKVDLERGRHSLFPVSSAFYSAKDESPSPAATAKSSNTASDEICITNFQRLDSGAVLFSWEGESDKLYDIEYSDNLKDWSLVATNKATINGIGDWMDSFSSPSHGFYRVWEGN